MTWPGEIVDRRAGVSYPLGGVQREALDFLDGHPRAALFLGMSMAKTMITLTYLERMIYRELAVGRALVIAPGKVARVTWPGEAAKWEHLAGLRLSLIDGKGPKERLRSLNSPAEVFVISVDNIVSLIDGKGPNFAGMGFDCVVIDELSLFKNRGSLRFKVVRKAMRGVPYRVGLTGTPSPNGLVDLWAEAALLDDGEALGGKFGEFAGKYFTARGNGMIVYEYRPRPGAAAAIAARLSPLAFSTGEGLTAAALPPSRVVDERVRLDGDALDAYERLERDLVLDVAGAGITANGAAALVSKLSQAAGGAVYDDEGGWVKLHDRKVDRAREIVASRPGEPVIIVYQYRHELERLREAFPLARELGKGKAVVGDVEAWNAGEIPVLLIHPASAGHGLNLQFGGHRLIWFAPTWNLEHYLQTNARLVRRGQDHEVIIHRLVATGTVDERVIARVLNKHNLQEFLFNEINLIRCKYDV